MDYMIDLVSDDEDSCQDDDLKLAIQLSLEDQGPTSTHDKPVKEPVVQTPVHQNIYQNLIQHPSVQKTPNQITFKSLLYKTHQNGESEKLISGLFSSFSG